MNTATFLQINGSIRSGKRLNKWFCFPKKRMIAHSVRFGNHAFIQDRKTMQILPVGNVERIEPDPVSLYTGTSGSAVKKRNGLPWLQWSGCFADWRRLVCWLKRFMGAEIL